MVVLSSGAWLVTSTLVASSPTSQRDVQRRLLLHRERNFALRVLPEAGDSTLRV